jgi:hypothetical protein
MIKLHNSRLKVEIAEPGTVYNRSRFDWTGIITQVTLDCEHTFCTNESEEVGVGCGGIGLSNEFGIDMPIGYKDAKIGEEFPKLGIGLLKKRDNGEYLFYKDYEVRPFPVSINKCEDSIKYIIHPLSCRGYEVRQEKTISIVNNTICIDYLIENVGTKPIHTNEYCHNFFRMNENTIGPEYRLKLPYEFKNEEEILSIKHQRPAKDLIVRQTEVEWSKVPEDTFYFSQDSVLEMNQCDYWELIHKPSGRIIREYNNYQISRFALWGMKHVVSPEVFVDIKLNPGEIQVWKRAYEFI